MTSLFDLYKIGIGPSSSHTMGPMRAAFRFAQGLVDSQWINRTERVQTELYGSLALTGIGHATDRAILLGLGGHEPATVDTAAVGSVVEEIRSTHQLSIAGAHTIHFDEKNDLLFHRDVMFPPGSTLQHPNGLADSLRRKWQVAFMSNFFLHRRGIRHRRRRRDTCTSGNFASPSLSVP